MLRIAVSSTDFKISTLFTCCLREKGAMIPEFMEEEAFFKLRLHKHSLYDLIIYSVSDLTIEWSRSSQNQSSNDS